MVTTQSRFSETPRRDQGERGEEREEKKARAGGRKPHSF